MGSSKTGSELIAACLPLAEIFYSIVRAMSETLSRGQCHSRRRQREGGSCPPDAKLLSDDGPAADQPSIRGEVIPRWPEMLSRRQSCRRPQARAGRQHRMLSPFVCPDAFVPGRPDWTERSVIVPVFRWFLAGSPYASSVLASDSRLGQATKARQAPFLIINQSAVNL